MAAIGAGAVTMRTPRGESQRSAQNAMLQNAGMPPLHTVAPIEQTNPYSRVSSAVQGQMLSQFSAPSDFGVKPAGLDANEEVAIQKGYQSASNPTSTAFNGRALSNVRAIPLDENIYQNLSQSANTASQAQFQNAADLGVNPPTPNMDASAQASMRDAFHTPASRAATVTAFGGDDTRPTQADVKAPVNSQWDLSQIQDPGIRAWAEHHSNAPKSAIDGKNIVDRFMEKQGLRAQPAESPATSSNTPAAQTLMSQAFNTNSPTFVDPPGGVTHAPGDPLPTNVFSSQPSASWQTALGLNQQLVGTVPTSGFDTTQQLVEPPGQPGSPSFAETFKQKNNQRIADAFQQKGGQFSPGLANALQGMPQFF